MNDAAGFVEPIFWPMTNDGDGSTKTYMVYVRKSSIHGDMEHTRYAWFLWIWISVWTIWRIHIYLYIYTYIQYSISLMCSTNITRGWRNHLWNHKLPSPGTEIGDPQIPFFILPRCKSSAQKKMTTQRWGLCVENLLGLGCENPVAFLARQVLSCSTL